MAVQNVLRIIKFGTVGITGMIIDFGITYLFIELVKVNKYIANAAGFTMAVIFNYIFNRIWTFNNNEMNVALQFVAFFLISLLGLLFNTSILYLFVSKRQFNFYLSK